MPFTTMDFFVELEQKKGLFTDGFVLMPLTSINLLKKYTDLVKSDPRSLRNNTAKRQAHLIMSDICVHCPEVFVLCALAAIPFQKLASLRSETFLSQLLQWWSQMEHPKGLSMVLERYADILPIEIRQMQVPEAEVSKVDATIPDLEVVPEKLSEPFRSTLRTEHLLSFLKNNPQLNQPHTLLVPYAGDGDALISISREMCQDLVEHVKTVIS